MVIARVEVKFFLRATLILAAMLTAVACIAQSQLKYDKGQNASATPSTCSGNQLSVRHESEDGAMGGMRGVVFSFRNRSSTACTLTGFPRFVMLDKTGHKIPVEGSKPNAMAPMVITLAPGKKAYFDIEYRSCKVTGDKPCGVSAKTQITAPGTERVFVLREILDPAPGTFAISFLRSSRDF